MRTDHVPQLPLALLSHRRWEDGTGKPVLFPTLVRVMTPFPILAPLCSFLSHPHPYPDKHREETPAARGQADVGIQEVLMNMGVGEQGEPGQD